MYSPGYLNLHQTGELAERAAALRELAAPCRLCPHECEVDRRCSQVGVCGSPYDAVVSSAFPHLGEEAPLVGSNGSGTVFLCGCNLQCTFCQNWEISRTMDCGRAAGFDELAGLMIDLQRRGCHNINFVTPTHFVHTLVSALEIAVDRGLGLPLVYNCGGYESVETLRLLDGVVDIYMPDVKFFDDATAARLLAADDYGTRTREALLEMHRQVGDLKLTPARTACRGLLIRHLVMPGGLAGTGDWARWIADNLSPDTYVNVMGQYRPCFRAGGDPEISRRPTGEELAEARSLATAAGLSGRGFLTDY